ncbi:hypothetical protein [Dankookia sp. P2]|uniref:hypothetical protein n=1 Tax=Dankookia sp. P2 TaxID=3423955 RepID=UPI003D67E129
MTVEEEVGAAFDRGWPERLADLGGAELLRGREEAIARTALMPDVLALVLAEPPGCPGRDVLDDFVLACAGVSVGGDGTRPSDYKDALEALAGADLADELAERCQDVLTRRAHDTRENEVARWAALGAALQLALVHPDLRHDLLRVLVRLKADDHHPEFARRAAKVAGVANAYWPDPSLEKVLDRLSAVVLARDEALFELGLARLRDGLDADAPGRVDASFEEARGHFEGCLLAREHRPDALSYARALAMLTALRRGEPPGLLASRAAEIRRELAIAAAWSSPTKPAWPWMGAQWTELMRWRELAGHIADLAEGVALGPEADLAIRRRLLDAYVANRAVLGREPGGVEVFMRPAIEARVLREESAEASALAWLEAEAESTASDWGRAARELLAAVRGGGHRRENGRGRRRTAPDRRPRCGRTRRAGRHARRARRLHGQREGGGDLGADTATREHHPAHPSAVGAQRGLPLDGGAPRR